jgi:hypothetical protein
VVVRAVTVVEVKLGTKLVDVCVNVVIAVLVTVVENIVVSVGK